MPQNARRLFNGEKPAPWWERTLSVAAALILGLGTLWLIKLLAWPLALLIGVVALAAAFSPLVERLAQWMPRTAAIIVLYLLLLGLFVLIGWLVVPPVWSEAQTVIDEGPQLVDQWQERLNNWLPGDSLSASNLINRFFAGTGLNTAVMRVSGLMTGVLTALVVIFFGSLYALFEAPRLHRFLLSLFPQERRDEVDAVLGEITAAMGGFIRGEMLAVVIIGVLTYIGLLLIGLPYAIVLAVVAGLLEFIPIVGPLVMAVILVLVGLSQSLNQAATALGLSILIQQIESNIVLPNVMRQEAKISPLLVLLSLLGGERIGGLLGALIAIPLVAGLRVVVVRVVVPAVQRRTTAEREPAMGKGLPSGS